MANISGGYNYNPTLPEYYTTGKAGSAGSAGSTGSTWTKQDEKNNIFVLRLLFECTKF